MKNTVHPEERPRGVRDSGYPSCKVQSAGKLVWIQDGQPMVWVDRPLKFPRHIRHMLTKRGGTEITDIKWMQLGGKAWWRLPEYPTGNACRIVTSTGRVLTDADFEALADEAERGYDITHLL